VDDELPGGIESSLRRLALPELDVEGPIEIRDPASSLDELVSHGGGYSSTLSAPLIPG
jgi:hypothetical protein